MNDNSDMDLFSVDDRSPNAIIVESAPVHK